MTNRTETPLPPLLMAAKGALIAELVVRLDEAGHGAIREGHGCVFGFVESEGSRLTYLAERAGLTKQAVGEAVDDLQRLGYVERIPDPTDGRAKLVRLTEKGEEVRQLGRETFADIEARWAKQVGEERWENLRETLEDLYVILGERIAVPA